MKNGASWLWVVWCSSLLALSAACEVLEVRNPGGIDDKALDEEVAFPGLVTGISGDLSIAIRRTSWEHSPMADELTHSGTHVEPHLYAQGTLTPIAANSWWGEAHRARWVAEQGVTRMERVLGGREGQNNLVARAHLLAGFANRLLGEHVCYAVIDGGVPQPFTVHFDRAEAHFTKALEIAERTGESNLRNAAAAGRASVRAALGRWSDAVVDAQQVPMGFRYDAIFSLNTPRENNQWTIRTQTRGEYTVWGTQWMHEKSDPRVPWQAVITAAGDTAVAANGRTKWVRQRKYVSDADNIALAKGTEMVLLRAEAALRQGNVSAAVALMNEGRGHVGLQPLTVTTLSEAWTALHRERGAVLWLEGRRMWDLRRWYQETGPARHPFLEGRDTCVPISDNEANSNPNAR